MITAIRMHKMMTLRDLRRFMFTGPRNCACDHPRSISMTRHACISESNSVPEGLP